MTPGPTTEDNRDVKNTLLDIELRLAEIEKTLARLVPLIETAEKYLTMTPMERVRASLKKT